MKFNIVLSIVLLILATTTQGLLKAAIAKKIPLLVSAVGGIKSSLTQRQNLASSGGLISTQSGSLGSSSGSLFSFSQQQQPQQQQQQQQQPIETLSAAIPPTVTLYQYPTEHQVIYRSIRPVVRRTIYVQEPTYSNRAIIDDIFSTILPNPITGALNTAKSIIGGFVGQLPLPVRATVPVSASAPPAVQSISVPATRQVYYEYL